VSEAQVCIYEVGPRDGLQNESQIVETDVKAALIQRLGKTGLSRIEIASFVSPEWIPQLADAQELTRSLPLHPGIRYSALVPNLRGYERFRASSGLDMAAIFISVSETHNQKNVNRSVDDHLERLRGVTERCRADGVPIRAYVSTAFGCVYEGEVDPARVARLTRDLVALGTAEVSLGDTVGVGHPERVLEVVAAVRDEVPLERVALHFHDTYGRGLVNVQAGYEAGVRIFDASLGGLGGCPYAPGAAGNVATEDVVGLFEAAGIDTGVDLDALIDVSAWLEDDVLQRSLGSRVLRAARASRQREIDSDA
jgi:hydroxymethylglutaryl-CoA lyase